MCPQSLAQRFRQQMFMPKREALTTHNRHFHELAIRISSISIYHARLQRVDDGVPREAWTVIQLQMPQSG